MSRLKRSDFSFAPYNNYAIYAVINDIDIVDQNNIAVAARDGVYLCDSKSGVVKYYHYTPHNIHSLAVLDDELLIYGGDDKRLTMYNYKSREVVYTFDVSYQVLEIKKLDEVLLVFSGKGKEVYFFNYKTKEILYSHHTGEHTGNMPLPWILGIEILDSDLIVFGGSDCKITIFNYKTKEVECERFVYGWARSITLTEDKVIVVDIGDRGYDFCQYKNGKCISASSKCDGYIDLFAYINGRVPEHMELKFLEHKSKEYIDGYSPDFLKKIDKSSVLIGGSSKTISVLECDKKDQFEIPRIDQIKDMLEIKKDLYLYLFQEYLVIYDSKNARVEHNIYFHFSRVYTLNEDAIILRDGLNDLWVYDLNKRRIVRKFISDKDKFMEDNDKNAIIDGYARVDNTTFIYSKGNRLSIYNTKTDSLVNIECNIGSKTKHIYHIIKLHEDVIAFTQDQKTIYFCNYKSGERLFKTEASFSKNPNTFIQLDHESIAYCTSEENYFSIVNYKTKQHIKEVFTSKTAIKTIHRIDNTFMAIIEEDNHLTFYDHKNKKVAYTKKMLHKVYGVMRTSDDLIAILSEKDTVSYLDFWGSKEIVKVMKFFEDGIINIYDTKKHEMTLIYRKNIFTPLDEKILKRHAWYMDKEGNVKSYKSFPKRVLCDRFEKNKVVLR